MVCDLQDGSPQCVYPEQADNPYSPPDYPAAGEGSDAGTPSQSGDAGTEADAVGGNLDCPDGGDCNISQGDQQTPAGDGCGCRTGARAPGGALLLLLLPGLVVRRRRARR